MSQHWSGPGVQFRALAPEAIERVYQAALECLERTGMNVHHVEGRDLLRRAGAQVDGVRVRFPPRLIQDAVAAAPGAFSLWNRDLTQQIDLQPGRVYFGPGPTSSYFIDPITRQRRRSTRQDVATTARVCDALDNIDYLMGLALPEDVDPARFAVFEFAEMAQNSRKPLMAWGNSLDNVQDIQRMAVAVRGSEAELRAHPLYALFAVGMGPLVIPDAVMGNALWCAGRGVPIVYHGPGVAGISAPITGAGTLAITLAGCLGGLAIIQLKQPGAPVALGTVPAAMDPRTGRPSYGGPELNLYSAAFAEIARHLGFPYMGVAGASEAKTLDLQAAIESTAQVIFSLLSGTGLPHDAGFLDCADIGALEMLVMTDEIIGFARRMMVGIEVSDATLMLDVIDQVGPGGDFLARKETARQLRQHIWLPRLMDRQPWNLWENAGSRDMLARIQARLDEILAGPGPEPLPPAAQAAIQAVLAA